MTLDAALDWAKANMPPGWYLEIIVSADGAGVKLKKSGQSRASICYDSLILEGDRVGIIRQVVNAAHEYAEMPPVNG